MIAPVFREISNYKRSQFARSLGCIETKGGRSRDSVGTVIKCRPCTVRDSSNRCDRGLQRFRVFACLRVGFEKHQESTELYTTRWLRQVISTQGKDFLGGVTNGTGAGKGTSTRYTKKHKSSRDRTAPATWVDKVEWR